MTDSILPCPFCGKQPKRFEYSGDERDSYADRVVYECACGCKKGAIGNTSKPGYADNSKVEQQAIAAWNTRAQPTSEPKPDVWRISADGMHFYGTKEQCERERADYESTFTFEELAEELKDGPVIPEPLFTRPTPAGFVLEGIQRYSVTSQEVASLFEDSEGELVKLEDVLVRLNGNSK